MSEDNNRSQLFLQRVTITTEDGEEIELPRELIIKASYIERLDLRAPLLHLDIHDFTRQISDNFKLKLGLAFNAVFGAPDSEDDMRQDTFKIVSCPIVNDTIKVEAVSASLWDLKQRTGTPLYLTHVAAGDILATVTSLESDIDPLTNEADFNLSNMQKPASALSKMAKENGAVIWLSAGKIFMRQYDTLINQEAKFKYCTNKPDEEYTLTKIKKLSDEYLSQSQNDYVFVGYNENEGYQSKGAEGKPVRLVPVGDAQSVATFGVSFKPVLDVECAGNASLKAGDTLEVILYRYDDENQIDESVPRNLVVGVVTQHEDRFSYRTRMILGVFN